MSKFNKAMLLCVFLACTGCNTDVFRTDHLVEPAIQGAAKASVFTVPPVMSAQVESGRLVKVIIKNPGERAAITSVSINFQQNKKMVKTISLITTNNSGIVLDKGQELVVSTDQVLPRDESEIFLKVGDEDVVHVLEILDDD